VSAEACGRQSALQDADEVLDAGAVTEDLLKRYHKKIFNVLLRMLGDFHEAADLTQDVFVQAYRALPTFRGESKIYTWLYRIAVNRAKNRMKQIARQNAMVAGHIEDPVDDEPSGVTAREYANLKFAPARLLEQQELQAAVNAAIEELPPDFRLVIVLRDLEGLSYSDMAEVIGISFEAVKSRLFRARSALGMLLKPYMFGVVDPAQVPKTPQRIPPRQHGPRKRNENQAAAAD